MGRNPKPVDQLKGHRSKDDLEKLAIAQEKYSTDKKDKLVPPSYLNELGVEKFYETIETYDHLNNMDLDALVLYCQAYSQWINRTIRMNNGDYEDEGKLQILIDKAEKTMSTFGSKMNLYATDRIGLANAQVEQIVNEGDVFANIGKDMMSDEDRFSIPESD